MRQVQYSNFPKKEISFSMFVANKKYKRPFFQSIFILKIQERAHLYKIQSAFNLLNYYLLLIGWHVYAFICIVLRKQKRNDVTNLLTFLELYGRKKISVGTR